MSNDLEQKMLKGMKVRSLSENNVLQNELQEGSILMQHCCIHDTRIFIFDLNQSSDMEIIRYFKLKSRIYCIAIICIPFVL